MNFENISIGTDIEEIKRFADKTLEKDSAFLNRIFTSKELEYSFKSKTSAHHLCARFCAKEAVVKALSEFNITDVYYKDIEILNKLNGQPFVIIEKYPQLKSKLTLSHDKNSAVAMVMIFNFSN